MRIRRGWLELRKEMRTGDTGLEVLCKPNHRGRGWWPRGNEEDRKRCGDEQVEKNS